MPLLVFELRRQADSLIYRFELKTDAQGREGYKRTDGDYWIIKHPKFGWVAGKWDSEEIFGRPWNTLPADQGPYPPEGIWVSRKGSRSYVYDLVHL
ncbi:MAG: hypothetical protein AAFW76_02695 [Pseudomonadota bacterium]